MNKLAYPAIMACLAILLAAVEPIPRTVHNERGEPYTTNEIAALSEIAKPPEGVAIVDVAQQFSAAMATMNKYETGASEHTGFSLFLMEPKAWVGVQKLHAVKKFMPFDPQALDADSHARVLRVFVHPDTPMNTLATWAANGAEHVVLRSLDKTLVAQPISISPTSETVQNIFGAKWAFAGLQATFSLSDLEEIRSASNNREFLVTIIGEKKNSNRDFHVKTKHFRQMGD